MAEEVIEKSEDQLTLANFAAAESLSKDAVGILQADKDADGSLMLRAMEVCLQSLYHQRR
jgi:hypothetical protein